MGCTSSRAVEANGLEAQPRPAAMKEDFVTQEVPAATLGGVGVDDKGAAELIQRKANRIGLTEVHQDIVLDKFDYAKLDVEKLDAFMSQVKDSVNSVVDISNGLNQVVVDAQEQVAIALGAFGVEVRVSVRGPPPQIVSARDSILIRLEKGSSTDGSTTPAPEEVKALCASNPAIKAADERLDAALTAVHAFLEKHNAVASLDGNNLGTSVPGSSVVQEFNEALAEMRAAIGDGFRVVLEAKHVETRGCRGVHARLVKPVFREGLDKEDYVNFTFLDVAKTREAKHIYDTFSEVLEACSIVAKSMQAVPSDLYKLKTVRHHLSLDIKPADPSDPCSAAVAKVLEGLKKAVAVANTLVSKLGKHAINAHGTATVGKGLVALFEEIVCAQAQQLGTEHAEAVRTITFDPRVKYQADSVMLEMPVKVTSKDGEALQSMQQVAQQLLQSKGKLLFSAIMTINEASMEIAPRFARLQSQIQDLIVQADQVYSQPDQDIRESFPDYRAEDINNLVQLAARNLQAVKDSEGVLESFVNQVLSLSTELKFACHDIQQRRMQLTPPLAGGQMAPHVLG